MEAVLQGRSPLRSEQAVEGHRVCLVDRILLSEDGWTLHVSAHFLGYLHRCPGCGLSLQSDASMWLHEHMCDAIRLQALRQADERSLPLPALQPVLRSLNKISASEQIWLISRTPVAVLGMTRYLRKLWCRDLVVIVQVDVQALQNAFFALPKATSLSIFTRDYIPSWS